MKLTRKLLSICLSLCIFFTCMIGMIAPSAAAEETTASTTDDPVIIVSLGDSYSSGEGIEKFYGQDLPVNEKVQNSDWLAHRSENAWSGMLTSNGFTGTASTHRNENWYFVAASGAKIEHLTKEQTKSYNFGGKTGTKDLDPQLKIFEGLNLTENDFITITIGGNDIGFVDILTAAIQKPDDLDSKIEDAFNNFHEEIRGNLKEAYKAIAGKSGKATIIVVGYPRLLKKDGFPFMFSTISSDTTQKVNNGIDNFNTELSELVNECYKEGMNIVFVPVADYFDGYEAYTENAFINGVIIGSQSQDLTGDLLISAYSFHPNAAGAAEYAAAVQAKINEIETARAKSFSALQTLINNTANGGTLTLDQNYTALSTDGYISIATDKTMTIDLNGHTIDRNLATATENGNVILNFGTLTIKDSGTGGKITGGNNTGNGGGINNNGILILESGSISGNSAALGGAIYNNGTLKLQTGDNPIDLLGNTTTGKVKNNVYLSDEKALMVDSLPSNGSQIGLTFETAATGAAPVTITSDCMGDISYFVSDNTDFVVVKDGDAAKLAVPVKVTFDKNDGTGATAEQTIPGGIASALNFPIFNRDHYDFSGWNTKKNGSGDIINSTSITITSDTIFYAQWTKKTYIVKFVDEYGQDLQSGAVYYDEIPKYNGENPTKASDAQFTYTFEKWSPDIEKVIGDATYTATYSKTINKYTIKFKNVDGTELQSSDIDYGETPEYKGPTPTITPSAQYTYTFDKWDKDIVEVKGEATYTATYTSTTNKYTIKFVNDDGTELQSSEVEYGKTPVYSGENPTKASDVQYTYAFDKWSSDIVAVTGKATYTATYSKTPNKYKITFVDEDGTELQSGDVEYGKTPVYSGKTPTKASDVQYSYTFDKWSSDIVAVSGEATYTATYRKNINKYAITFVDEDGTVLQSLDVEYGEIPAYSGNKPAKAPDSKYTYTFDKWTPEIAKVTGKATYTATYTSKVNEHISGEKKIENKKEPTCTEDGSYDEVIYCETCKEELYRKTITVDATGHKWGDWEVVKKPTVNEKGTEQRVCANDPTHIETREIEKLPKMTYKSQSETFNWQKGTGKALTWSIHRDEDDKNCILHYLYTLMDGEKIPVDAKSGSTIITISADILEKLNAGTHLITVQFDDGEAVFSLVISAAATSPDTTPTTGDSSNPVLWYLLTLFSLAGLAMFTRYSRKRAEE